MAKRMTVVVFNVPTSGHVDPSLPLTAELVSRGHEVIYYLTEGYRNRVELTGAVYRETPGVPADFFNESSANFNPMRLATLLLAKAYELAGPMAAVVKEEKADFVLFDSMCPWGWLAADLAGVKGVSSMSLISPNFSNIVKGGQLGRLVRLLPRMLQSAGSYRQAVKQIEEKYGVQLPRQDKVINQPGDLTISYTTAEIHPEADTLGSSYLFIGPSIGYGMPEVDFNFDELDGRPLIYASLGTVFNGNVDFFKDCIAAFRGSEYQVVMSLGRRLPVSALGEVPENFIVRDYVPQLDILERSSLYITHGGVGSIHQALYWDVPLLFIPQQLEHAMTAVRLEELGAGLLLRKNTAQQMRATAERVMGDGLYREAAARLGAGLKAAGGVKAAVDRLEIAMV